MSGSGHTAAARRGANYLRASDSIILVILFAGALLLLARSGILFSETTYSDETQHLRRAMVFARIFRGELSMDLLATFYGGGIWPPLYPAIIGTVEGLFGIGVGGLRLLNVAMVFAGLALLTRCVEDPRLRLLSLMIPSCLLLGTSTYFQVRPENLAVLLVGFLMHLIARRRLFSKPSRNEPRAKPYGQAGVIVGLLCLTHAVFALAAAYLAALALVGIRRRYAFLLTLAVAAGPYFVAQNLIHGGVNVFATTAEENLARNNNPFLREAVGLSADDLLFAEMERRYAAGDRIPFPKPLLVPQGRYEQWLHDENKRRIFKEIALEEIRIHPIEALRRARDRIAHLIIGDDCLDDGRYGCLVSPMIDRSAYVMLVALGLSGIVAAVWTERRRSWNEISFGLLCFVLFLPMVLTQALVRHFVVLLLIGAYSGLLRLGWSTSGKPTGIWKPSGTSEHEAYRALTHNINHNPESHASSRGEQPRSQSIFRRS